MEQQKTIGFLLYGGALLWCGLYLEQKPYMKKLQKSYKVNTKNSETHVNKGFERALFIEWE